MDAYVDVCVADLDRWRDHGIPAFDTVFFGGGTPSLLPSGALEQILAAMALEPNAEVTVECNPDSVDAPQLASYASAGVTRVSLGVQSMHGHVLASLGRTHDPAAIDSAVDATRAAGIEHLNLDLIYGAAGESVDDWTSSLDAALALEPDHISAYALTVESGTPLAQRIEFGEVVAPDDDDQATKYEIADERLTSAGFAWYEISNWARAGGECRHNLGYWHDGEWLAIGAAAHGRVGGRRWWNVRTPERYLERIDAGASPEAAGEAPDPGRDASDEFSLALRTRRGARLPAAARTVADGLAADGLLELGKDRVVLTRRGRLLATDVTARLLNAGAVSTR